MAELKLLTFPRILNSEVEEAAQFGIKKALTAGLSFRLR